MTPILFETKFYIVQSGDNQEYNYVLKNKDTGCVEYEHNMLPMVIKASVEATEVLEKYYELNSAEA